MAEVTLADLQAQMNKLGGLDNSSSNAKASGKEQRKNIELQAALEAPYKQAELTGTFNGQQTVAAQQLDAQRQEWEKQFGLDTQRLQLEQLKNQDENAYNQAKLALDTNIQTGQLQLAQLTQAQKNALDTANFQLAAQIENQKQALAEKIAGQDFLLKTADQSGVMSNGQLTEAARAARANEAMHMSEISGQIINVDGSTTMTEQAKEFAKTMALETTKAMGYDPTTGQQTDAAQQWRTSAALEYAKTQAQLQANPRDYFEAAAFARNAGATGAVDFLNQINQTGFGTNMGFRSAGGATPGAGSMQGLVGMQGQVGNQMPGIQSNMLADPNFPIDEMAHTSVANAQAAAAGQPMTYDSQMNQTTPTVPGATDPTVAQAQGAAGGMSYGTTPDAAQAKLNAFQPILQQGMQKLAPGAYESMSPTERALFDSAAKASGLNPDDLAQSYKRTRLQDANFSLI